MAKVLCSVVKTLTIIGMYELSKAVCQFVIGYISYTPKQLHKDEKS
ncbi:hypothetical protein [Staphylococcus capitis]|nr:hypothetical protein [Staphylococcus capitis]NMK90600.1 hypothetical protein [Staphylococcus capitis]NMK92061.1 hypothetical protein [Staphylococcus capitis]